MKSPHNNNKNCNNKLESCQRQEILNEPGKRSQIANNCETETRAMMRATHGGYCMPNDSKENTSEEKSHLNKWH